MIRVTAIAVLAVAAIAFFGESDYQAAIDEQEKRCMMMELYKADSHLRPLDRRGWPESYPGQYESECEGEE